MSQERSLVSVPPSELVTSPQTLDVMLTQAEHVAKSGLAGTSDPSTVLTKALVGYELGIRFMAAVRGVHVIEKKPSLSAELMQAVIERDHGDDALRVVESTDKQCVIRYRKRGWSAGDYQTTEFSIEDAKAAGLLGKDNWRKYPKAMLRSRAIAQAAHEAFASSLLGMYTPDELGDASMVESWSMEPGADPLQARVRADYEAEPSTEGLDALEGEYVDIQQTTTNSDKIDPATGEYIEAEIPYETPIDAKGLAFIHEQQDIIGLSDNGLADLTDKRFGTRDVEHLTADDGRKLYRELKKVADKIQPAATDAEVEQQTLG